MLVVLTPPPEDALVPLDEAKAELGIEGTGQDGRVRRMVAAASGALAQFCNRPEGFGRAEVQETFTVRSPCARLLLHRDLEPEVLSVHEGGALLPPSLYALDGARLWRLDAEGGRSAWAGDAMVRYRAGFALPTGAPALLAEACLSMVAAAHRERGRDPGVRSERTEGVGQTDYFAARDVPADPAVEAAVARYRRVGFV